MEVNTPGKILRTASTKSSCKSSSSHQKSSFSSERSSPVFSVKSPIVSYHYSQDLPKPQTPSLNTIHGQKTPLHSPKTSNYQNSPSSQTEKIFTFCQVNQKCDSPTILKNDKVFDFSESVARSATPRSSPNLPKSPKSPRAIIYETDQETASKSYTEIHSPSGNNYNFNIQAPPKSKLNRSHNRQQFQSSKNGGGSSSSKSSLEYVSTTKHPTGDYESVEYKICNSIDSSSHSGSNFDSNPNYYFDKKRRVRHSSIKEKSTKKPICNIRTNPGYDERYWSSKSINESEKNEKCVSRCRKSTSDLTDLTDDAPNTTVTSLSRPTSPRRNGSIKGGLAYLASRRGSRDSLASNVSNEDIGPLNFQNTPRGRQRRTSNFLELPVPDHIRPRVCSLPEKAYNPRLSDDLYRLRTFSITNKGGVVNCGDSIINRRSRSNTSVNSTTSKASNISGERSPFEGSCCGSGYHTVDSTPLGSPEEAEVPKYRVVMLGDSGVGKTALVSQFMTSEYMNTYDASLDDEFGERTVSILLDGEESEMIFIDHPASEMSVENSLSTYEPHACVVIYSIVARPSFQHAEETLNYLWREGYTHEKSVIVVGNKADLARSRVISSNDGKSLAVSRDCKFIETSSGIQHNVDELLVGILKQIRLRESREKKKATSKNKLHGSKTSLSLNIAREILQKICMNDISKSKSCENLHVL
ncbi:hypothetical protein PPYR_02564 [Photinus pyralis]|uniref:Uncharacterized protein n=2 Tax=Photinus pyralis TaxID=7054 RepID=A0A5N4B7Q8_PHOPY|nr:uncharacterized protein LOC116159948 [Photinus pyralis]KAB0805594.1 hypothetical protein PPYR_02564 [Photinus pyralis]